MVEEKELYIGYVKMCREFYWNVDTSLQSTLIGELDLRRTNIVPNVDQIEYD